MYMYSHACYYSASIACCSGIAERADGMLMLISHGQTHVVHQKRAYLCIKFIVNLCNRFTFAHCACVYVVVTSVYNVYLSVSKRVSVEVSVLNKSYTVYDRASQFCLTMYSIYMHMYTLHVILEYN